MKYPGADRLIAMVAKIRVLTRQKTRQLAVRRQFEHMVRLAEQVRHANLPAETTEILISVVTPVFNTPAAYLDDLLNSISAQNFINAELVLCDDGSTDPGTLAWLKAKSNLPHVTIRRTADNQGIAAATNAGIHAAKGVWVALVDHDDALAPEALAVIARTLEDHPECMFLYTDEVIADGRMRPTDFFLKPAYDPVLLSGVNYINHLSIYKRDRLIALGGMREGFQGSQDYDLLLRYLRELKAADIMHVAYPAYMWRRDGKSFSSLNKAKAISAARRALTERYKSGESFITVDDAVHEDLHRVQFGAPGPKSVWPMISVIIPNRDSYALISRLLADLRSKTDYPDFEVIIPDNGSTDDKVLQLYQSMADAPFRFRVEIEPGAFNFSKSINSAAQLAEGEAFLLLNNDIEIEDASWLKEMVSCLNYPDVGIVGAMLLYPDRTIQHAGVIAGLGDLAGHWYIGRDEFFPGPMGRLWVRQSLSVVTGACMLITRDCFRIVGTFDETTFPVAYNDVDYCLRATKLDIRIVWTPFAKLIHHESASRGSDETPENIARFTRDKANLQMRHATRHYQDRAFNPWLSRHHSEPTPVQLEELPPAR